MEADAVFADRRVDSADDAVHDDVGTVADLAALLSLAGDPDGLPRSLADDFPAEGVEQQDDPAQDPLGWLTTGGSLPHWLAERYLELRYEDIVDDPRGSWPAILDLAGLTWSDAFEDAFRRYPVATSRREAFRTDLTPAQVAQLEDAIGPYLEARGYRPGEPAG